MLLRIVITSRALWFFYPFNTNLIQLIKCLWCKFPQAWNIFSVQFHRVNCKMITQINQSNDILGSEVSNLCSWIHYLSSYLTSPKARGCHRDLFMYKMMTSLGNKNELIPLRRNVFKPKPDQVTAARDIIFTCCNVYTALCFSQQRQCKIIQFKSHILVRFPVRNVE